MNGFQAIKNALEAYKGITGFARNKYANDMIREAGFDGIIANYREAVQYVAFSPDQIKLTTNLTPTPNPDIRYSERAASLPTARQVLARAFEGVAETDAERALLSKYQSEIKLADALSAKILELRSQAWSAPYPEKEILAKEAAKYDRRLEDIDKKLMMLRNARPLQDLVTRERRKVAQRMQAKSNERVAALRARTKYGVERAKVLASIDRQANTLKKWALTPDTKNRVPEPLRNTVSTLLRSLDMAWTDRDGAEVSSFRSRSWQEAMNMLAKRMQDANAFVEDSKTNPTVIAAAESKQRGDGRVPCRHHASGERWDGQRCYDMSINPADYGLNPAFVIVPEVVRVGLFGIRMDDRHYMYMYIDSGSFLGDTPDGKAVIWLRAQPDTDYLVELNKWQHWLLSHRL